MESAPTEYTLRPSHLFVKQLDVLMDDEVRRIDEKLELARQNPFRYKSLRIKGLTKAFEIKITLQDKYSRIVYQLDGNEILVEGIINRKDDFKDLLPLLYKAMQERLKK